jgi:5'-nucleotidase
MLNRKDFLKKSLISSGLVLVGQYPYQAFAKYNQTKLTILHTNDVHSRIDAFPQDGGKFAGLGGVAPRAAMIEQIRKKEDHVLLLDSGDIFQGTPYFNFYKGELEMACMSKMGYDAATMGNHDFDNGVQGFANQLPHTNFSIICSNYTFNNNALEGKTVPYKIVKKGKLKIGILGIGIELDGLVPNSLCAGVTYQNPVEKANETAELLKTKYKCDYIICLSHLGYEYEGSNKISDLSFAPQTRHIDLILGAHTHTFLTKPVTLKNKDQKDILVNQVGWGGIVLGRIDVFFEETKKTNDWKSHTVEIGKEKNI